MLNISRYYKNKIPESEKSEIKKTVTDFIFAHSKPSRMFFFGSILTSVFDSHSDIDVLLVFKTDVQADQARRELHQCQRNSQIQHSLEIICVDKSTFDRKSSLGGVCSIAATDGEEVII